MEVESSSPQENAQEQQHDTEASPPAIATTPASGTAATTATTGATTTATTGATTTATTGATTTAATDAAAVKGDPVSTEKGPDGAAKASPSPGQSVTFKVNNVKPTGKDIQRFTTAERLASVKLVDPDAHSKHPRGFLKSTVDNGFIGAVTLAFDAHLPLSLRPEHFWTLILQGVASHVTGNAEALRKKFVKHNGKKVLEVVRNEFVLGKAGNDWAGVVTEFNQQVNENLVPGAAAGMEMRFSGTTADERTCGTVAVMSAMQKFFNYRVMTMCGFPSITLEGSVADWQLLRHKAEALVRTRCLPELGKRWLPAMLPVLDRFVRQYQNPKAVDVKFWQCMCKRGGVEGSGGYDWLNGWFNVFIPYLKDNDQNRLCVPYSDDIGYAKEGLKNDNYYCHFFGPSPPEGAHGPSIDDVPTGLVVAPVEWKYHGRQLNLEFKSGFVGVEQREGGVVAPCLGWYIQHMKYY